jgi:Fe-S-cluster containining protein
LKIPPHLRRRAITLFEQMDRAYDDVARPSGFVCNGCTDNCCMTRFFHHTLLEYLYLEEGLGKLVPEVLVEVKAQAESVVEQTAAIAEADRPVRIMCPLNQAGRCILYAHRPMICRLHGIAHMLRRPDGQTQTGPGCDDFYAQCGPSPDHQLDRTPLYVAMAKLERQLREALGYNGKIKMTIAEMILDDSLKFKD